MIHAFAAIHDFGGHRKLKRCVGHRVRIHILREQVDIAVIVTSLVVALVQTQLCSQRSSFATRVAKSYFSQWTEQGPDRYLPENFACAKAICKAPPPTLTSDDERQATKPMTCQRKKLLFFCQRLPTAKCRQTALPCNRMFHDLPGHSAMEVTRGKNQIHPHRCHVSRGTLAVLSLPYFTKPLAPTLFSGKLSQQICPNTMTTDSTRPR